MALTAANRAIDKARAKRMVLAWAEGDATAFDVAVDETANDPYPGATPGALLAAVGMAAELIVGLMPDDYADVLRAEVVADVQAADAGQ